MINIFRNKKTTKPTVVLVALNMPSEYSLALYYLKLYAEQNEFIKQNIRIVILEIDLTKSIRSVLGRILKAKPDVIGFSCYIWNIEKTLKVAKYVKRFFRIPVILGGQEVTNSYIDYLKLYPFLDILVDGEGEVTFSVILENYLKKNLNSLSEIEGIQYRQSGMVYRNDLRAVIPNLESVPSPYLSGAVNINNRNHYGMMIELTRGCSNSCRFCFEGIKYSRARCFPVERIEKEIDVMVSKGLRKFHFLDPIIGSSNIRLLRYLKNVFENLRKRGIDYFIPVEVYAEYVNEKNVDCFSVYSAFDLGLQSISQEVHSNIERNFDIKNFIKGYQLLKSLQKEIIIYLIIGLPGDNIFSHLKSTLFTITLNPTYIFLNYLYILNGSALRSDLTKYGIKHDENPPYRITDSKTFSGKELNYARILSDTITKEFNLNISLYKKVNQISHVN
jgi:radical SAM superfamily enzyme YgiQ (UPF0313 family)